MELEQEALRKNILKNFINQFLNPHVINVINPHLMLLTHMLLTHINPLFNDINPHFFLWVNNMEELIFDQFFALQF